MAQIFKFFNKLSNNVLSFMEYALGLDTILSCASIAQAQSRMLPSTGSVPVFADVISSCNSPLLNRSILSLELVSFEIHATKDLLLESEFLPALLAVNQIFEHSPKGNIIGSNPTSPEETKRQIEDEATEEKAKGIWEKMEKKLEEFGEGIDFGAFVSACEVW
jgi:hypothetical protein